MKVLVRRRLFRQRVFRQVLLALFLLAILLGFLIAPIERNADGAQIEGVFDGIYWAVTTLTTVGYGDIVPVTRAGKMLSMALQLIGAMMFGLLIAMIGTFVNRIQDEFYWGRLFERLDALEDQVKELKKQSTYLVKDTTNGDE